MKLIVGLGNPGEKYARNRHNVGFMAVDRLFDRYGFEAWRRRFQGEVAEGRIGGEKCLLLKPATYMNESGRSVGEALRFYKLDLADVIVIYDEIDLAPGRLKAKSGGGNAGHNGLRSLSAHIGNDYLRVRIGVGRPLHKAQVANFVLHDFAKADGDWLEPLLTALAAAMPVLLTDGAARFSSEVARRLAPEEKADVPKTKPAVRGAASGSEKKRDAEGVSTGQGGPFSDLLRAWSKPKKQGD